MAGEMVSGNIQEAQLQAQIDTALEMKDQAAAAFRAGDYPAALKKYHHAVLNLKGIRNQESFRVTALPVPKIQEIQSEDGDGERSTTPAQVEKVDDKYSFEAVKRSMAACYVNMAIIHSKSSAWAKCKRAAESALGVDKDNFKAKFRVAQATVRLGEIGQGRKKLEELRKEKDDAAIATEFKVLEAAEAAREKKHKEAFRGFLKSGPQSSPEKTQDEGFASDRAPPSTPRFTELNEEADSGVTTPFTIKEDSMPLTPPKSD